MAISRGRGWIIGGFEGQIGHWSIRLGVAVLK
jgi:hypothetical protein